MQARQGAADKKMSLGTIVEFLALVVVLAVGGAAVYVIFEMREVYAEQRDQFLRAIAATESFQKLQPEFLSAIKLMQSDGHALQNIAVEIERAVAELNNNVSSAVKSSAERHASLLGDVCDHIDWQESKLTEACEGISNDLQSLAELRTRPAERSSGNAEYVRLGKDILEHDPRLRFTLMRDWVVLNSLAISRRAGRGWKAPKDLIAGVPDYLQAAAEVIEDRVLLVSTHGHAEILAIPIKDLDSTCQFAPWFKFDGHETIAGSEMPAVLARSNGIFELIQKGTTHLAAQPQLEIWQA